MILEKMIKKIKTNLKRKGKTVEGQILNVKFIPNYYGQDRGYAKFRKNDRFLILSTNYPKITYLGNREDHIMALHI
ncbi:hypothetical protein KAH94_04230 [bacterium]|nr:hypothetical protein [bacterium]